MQPRNGITAPPLKAAGSMILPLRSGRHRSSHDVIGSLTWRLSTMISMASNIRATPEPLAARLPGFRADRSVMSLASIFCSRPAPSARKAKDREIIATSNGGSSRRLCILATDVGPVSTS